MKAKCPKCTVSYEIVEEIAPLRRHICGECGMRFSDGARSATSTVIMYTTREAAIHNGLELEGGARE
jgi:hypothetical protein